MIKKTIYILAITVLIGGFSLLGCKSNTKEKEDAIENVQDANEDLQEVEANQTADEITKANDQEWQTFKSESNKTIIANDNRIMELKKAMNKPGTTFDASYTKGIDELQEKNTKLKKRILNYENNQTDWESFKREFNSDADVVKEAFKDLTSNKKK